MALDNHSSFEISSYLNGWVEIMLLIKLWKLISCNFCFFFRQRRSCGCQSLESHYWGHEIRSPYSSCSCSLLSLLNSFSWCCLTEPFIRELLCHGCELLRCGVLSFNLYCKFYHLLREISALNSWLPFQLHYWNQAMSGCIKKT